MADKLKLDIGCGRHASFFEGFTGLDVCEPPPAEELAGRPWLRLNFMEDTLPWAPGTVDEIISTHVIEHMPRATGVQFLRKAWALLKPGGKLTVTTPDLRILCSRYLAGDLPFWNRQHPEFGLSWPGTTLCQRFNHAVHPAWGQGKPWAGHVYIYDTDDLLIAAHEAGAVPVRIIPESSPYYKRPDHETGIEATKAGGK